MFELFPDLYTVSPGAAVALERGKSKLAENLLKKCKAPDLGVELSIGLEVAG